MAGGLTDMADRDAAPGGDGMPQSPEPHRAMSPEARDLYSPGAGAPADEIEITSEMIEAGCAAARLYDREDPKDWEIAAVYRAMEIARRQGSNGS
jgi:hypothetical protein